jgi:hypothetical protein
MLAPAGTGGRSLTADFAAFAGGAGGIGAAGAALLFSVQPDGALSALQQQLHRGQTHSTQHLWTGTSSM